MEAENGMFCEFKKIFQPQLVGKYFVSVKRAKPLMYKFSFTKFVLLYVLVIPEPACKISESRNEDSVVCCKHLSLKVSFVNGKSKILS